MKQAAFLLPVGLALTLAGCTLAPEYARPTAPVPTKWPEGAAYAEASTPTDALGVEELQWQEFFTDPALRQVIGTALTNNLDLRVAVLNVERARALYGIQRAELWPTVDAVGRGTRQRVPADLSNSGTRRITERYDANLGVASWEIDLFGRIRSLKDRALEDYLATEQAQRSAQILLVSAVADAYLTLAADRENLALAENTLQAQREAYRLIQRRFHLGLVTELDLYRAQAQVDTARGDIARLTQWVARDENALNLLAGAQQSGERLPRDLTSVAPPADLHPGVSSDVLLRRPDVQQAEHLLKAANADIGAARAAFFPRIALTTAVGSASSELAGLFKAGSGVWSYAPEIVMPIFDARTWSAHRAAKVQREIAVAQYESAIQQAFKEVADALAIRGTVGRQLSAQESLVRAVAETYRLSASRYDKGIDGYWGVLDAQRSLYAARQGWVDLRLAQLISEVRLYAALGGGGSAPGESAAFASTPAAPADR